MVVSERWLLIVCSQIVPGGMLGLWVQYPGINKEAGYGIAVISDLPVCSLIFEKLFQKESFHHFLQKKVSDVQRVRGRSFLISMPDLLVEVNGHVKTDFSYPVFLIHLLDLFPYIGQRIISDLKEFRMLPEFFHIPRCSFLSDAYTLLSVISWVGKALVIVEFHGFSPLYLLYHKNTTHTTLRREKFDKKRPPFGGL